MWFLGIVIGFILGAVALQGFGGGLAGALAGFIIALAIRSRTQTIERQAAPRQFAIAATPGNVPSEDAAPTLRSVAARLAGIEDRLLRLEVRLGAAPPAAETVSSTPAMAAALPSVAPELVPESIPATAFTAAPRASQIDIPAAPEPAALPEGWIRAFDGTLQPPPASNAAVPAAQDAEVVAAAAAPAHVPQAARTVPPPRATTAPNPLWAWFTGGNALTRIGVVVLFFGVGFLLKYFARYFTIPIELRLAGVALVGAALIALGIRLGAKRPGYGLSLQGAGAGILYLTVYAAFHFYDVLPAAAAFVLLALIAALTVGLAIRNDSQPLAGLAIAGGFLAPFLVETHTDEPALLFGYFAVLNGAIFAVAWLRAWRALNVLGFLFTFALGLLWGHTYYTPEHFATVEPFLVLFFAFYVAIAILYAKQSAARGARAGRRAARLWRAAGRLRAAGRARARHALRRRMERVRRGRALRRVVRRACAGDPHRDSRLLARSFLVLAIVFATIAIPFAADPRWTSAWWALEAAAVYWIGCEQRQGLARAFALLLQLGAALAFVLGGPSRGRRPLPQRVVPGHDADRAGGLRHCHSPIGARRRSGIGARAGAARLAVGAVWWYRRRRHGARPRTAAADEGNAISPLSSQRRGRTVAARSCAGRASPGSAPGCCR